MIKKFSEMNIEIKNNMRGGSGEIEIKHMFSKEEFKSNVRLCSKITINPGCSIGEHQHLDEDEVYFIISGKGKVNDGKNEYEVSSGDAVLTGNGGTHSIKCLGDTPLEMVAFIVLY